jgi:hypothetical protein
MQTDITIVVDRSGSMVDVLEATISGYNKFLDEQKKVKDAGDACITFNQFDNVFETLCEAMPIQEAIGLDTNTFVPRGSTALLDAIGRSIIATEERLNRSFEPPKQVIFVIITDGYENASREFTRQQIFDMITKKRDENKWEFIFLGANQDAIAEATKIGIQSFNSLNFVGDNKGVTDAFGHAGSGMACYRAANQKLSDGYFDTYTTSKSEV